ncbi:MAG: BamA/TamA family outer membrane protein [candidate division WOR-3 bacterium]
MITTISLLLVIGITGQVDAVKFAGNRSFPTRLLRSLIQTKPGQPLMNAQLVDDVRTLENFYTHNGFFAVKIEKGIEKIKGKTVVKFYINEGMRSRISDIVITGNYFFSVSRLKSLLPFGVKDYYNRDLVVLGAHNLRNLYLDNGYPFVQVQDTVTVTATSVTVCYIIEEGPCSYIQAIRVRGNKSVATPTILRTIGLAPREKFSRYRLEMAKRRLYASRLFSRAHYYVIKNDSFPDSVTIRFDVVEQKQKGIGIGIGVETPPSRVLISLDWEHNNLLNRGQMLFAATSFAIPITSYREPLSAYRFNFDITWRVPYLFYQRIDFQTHPFFYYEKLDSTRLREYGIETGMSRDIVPLLRLGIFNRLRLVADTSRGITNSLALNLIYDNRDNLLDPRQGFYILPVMEIAGGPFLGDNHFVRGRADCRVYRTIGPAFVVAIRVAGGRVVPYGRSTTIPYYEEFFLGGANTLRGYNERSLGPDTAQSGRYGPIVVNTNLELRTPYFFRWVGVVSFLDLGQVARESDIILRGVDAGAGIGIRVKTPIGPIRLDWGKRLKAAPRGDLGKIYIGVLHAF